MSSTDSRTVDPTHSHPSENGGHEMSDFSWTTVLWLIPLSVVILLTFFAVCIAWFKGAKDHELESKQAAFQTTELNQLHAKEGEVLSSYKWVDKEKGRVQIPIAQAMEQIAKEHRNSTGREWKPITDTYLQGAAFSAQAAAPANEGPSSGISIDEVEAPKAEPASKEKHHAAEGHKAEERAK
ncbi:MAG TPA: hypothetical protein VJ385_12905 [Fibrobacteria bacterium]|nr:hypothetical protein [Fibrobacteria bacterium]